MVSLSQAIAFANQSLASGQLSQAELLCQQLLQQQPDCAEALYLLGAIAHRSGKLAEAIIYYLQTIAFSPNYPEAYYSLGAALSQQGQLLEAISYYQQAITLKSDYTDAYYDLANAFQQLGDFPAAIYHYQQALTINPNDAEVHGNLANLLLQQGEIQAAILHYQQVIYLRPNITGIYYNLGNALLEQHNYSEAIIQYQHALALDPKFVDALVGIGTAFRQQFQFEEAFTYFQQALAINPHCAEAYFNWGMAFAVQNQLEQAINYWQQALQSKPTFMQAYWHNAVILPVLYDTSHQISAWRQRFCQGLNYFIKYTSLNNPQSVKSALAIFQEKAISFYIAYQGLNERGIQAKLGKFLHQLMAANYPQLVQSLPLPPLSQDGKIRIGYLSTHLRNHTVGKLTLGWLKNCDRQSFEIYTYQVAAEADYLTERFRSYSDYFYHNYGNIQAICQQVMADKLHILVFTDIGMSPFTNQIAALRLAPIQCTTWGHPVTTGLPTIDYYLSSDLMEPKNAQAHYSEKLIRLPNIGMCYEKPEIPKLTKNRADFSIREDAILYLSCQSLFKYLPQFDQIFAQIAKRVPQAQFAFISHDITAINHQFKARLKRVFAEFNLDSEAYCILLPRMNHIDYLNLNLLSEIFLDTFSWSGGNTTLEAIACGLPVVTCPKAFMRGRHAYGILQMMGITTTIAHNEAEYVEIAVKLGLDQEWRQEISRQITELQDKVYDDQTCVTALESFYKQVVGR